MGNREIPPPSWPLAEPPFHAGERELQARTGVQERMAEIGSRVIRPEMPEQHRELFGKLPFMLLGALDEQRRPWAAMVAGNPGFVRTPDARTLRIGARPLGEADLPALQLGPGAALGILGLEPSTRRRNRVNGIVSEVFKEGFELSVRQSFGNCPKYIQARSFRAVEPCRGRAEVFDRQLPAKARALAARADTFFIATASADAGQPGQAPSGGVDVSHRGGAPGFVRIADEEGTTVLCVPDFLGNFFFNTLGNIAAYPRAGLLFVDWATGDLMALSGEASVVWDGPLLQAHPGAQRVLRVRLAEGRWLPEVLPWRAEGVEYAPQLATLGAWTG